MAGTLDRVPDAFLTVGLTVRVERPSSNERARRRTILRRAPLNHKGASSMSRSHAARTVSRKRRRRRFRLRNLLPSARLRRRWFRSLRAAPFSVQLILGLTGVVAVWFAINGVYQVIRKPAELFFPVSGALAKAPPETWRRYEAIFREHSTAVVTADLLAALAQVESTGNPVARTYWRWSATWEPFKVYRPASSAVGMYQITDATFLEAKRYCIHYHAVVEDGPWNDLWSCWFNGLYTRVVPSHAVELTSALLDRRVARTLERRGMVAATLQQKQNLAAVIHLCGAAAGDAYARRGFQLTSGQRCGDHDAARYLARVNAMKRLFARLADAE